MPDSFSPIAQTTKHLDKLQIVLTVTPGTPNTYAGTYTFHILNENNEVLEPRTGNLVPHLTAGQVTAIRGFLDTMLTKAQGALV